MLEVRIKIVASMRIVATARFTHKPLPSISYVQYDKDKEVAGRGCTPLCLSVETIGKVDPPGTEPNNMFC